MTQTRRWLEVRRSQLARREWAIAALATIAAATAAMALGIWFGRLGVYQRAPVVVMVTWVGVVAAIVWATRWAGVRLRANNVYQKRQ